MNVSAVIVTRGDVDLGPCLAGIEADEITIVRGHMGVWERWEAVLSAKHRIVYTQDDDCVVDFTAVAAEYEPGKIVCNMPGWKRPEYPDAIALVGWGAVMDRALVGLAIGRYAQRFEWMDALTRREADRVITGLSPLKLIDAPFVHLPHASGPGRMSSEKEHLARLREIRERIAVVRGN